MTSKKVCYVKNEFKANIKLGGKIMDILLGYLPFIGGAIVVIVLLAILASGYVKSAPDEAIIISGITKEPRVIIGKAAIKLPFLERKDRLTLKAMKIDVRTKEPVPNLDYINVSVDAVVTLKISSNAEAVKRASENFLNQSETYIKELAVDILEGNIREIVGTMTLVNMISDRQTFSQKVQENAVPDMEKLGLEIISFNVQNFSDKDGVINDLGIDNVAKIQKNAKIVKAEAERDIAIAQSKADTESNEAKANSQEDIAIRNNQLSIRKSELKQVEDAKRAEADASYKIQEEAQRKTIEVARANADLAKQEKDLEIKEREIIIMEKTLDANVKKKADADKYAKEKIAEADLFTVQKKAEADRIKVENESLGLRAMADAQSYARIKESEALKLYLLAEADGIEAKGVAEAMAIEKKAEAMTKMGEAAILEMFFNVLPSVAENVAKPLQNINSITMYGEGNNAKMVGDITKSMSQIISSVADSTGLDLKSVLGGFLGAKAALPKGSDEIVVIEKNDENYQEVK